MSSIFATKRPLEVNRTTFRDETNTRESFLTSSVGPGSVRRSLDPVTTSAGALSQLNKETSVSGFAVDLRSSRS